MSLHERFGQIIAVRPVCRAYCEALFSSPSDEPSPGARRERALLVLLNPDSGTVSERCQFAPNRR